MDWRLAGWLLFASAVLGLVLVCLMPARILGVSESQLAVSLARASDAVQAGCSRQGSDEGYWCGIEFSIGSGWSSYYRVVRDDGGCWTATAARFMRARGADKHVLKEVPARRGYSGCIDIVDHLLFWKSVDGPAWQVRG